MPATRSTIHKQAGRCTRRTQSVKQPLAVVTRTSSPLHTEPFAPDAMNIPVQDAGELLSYRSVSTDLHTYGRAALSQRALDAMRCLRAAHRNTRALVDRP